jgi:hypothetical protein
MINSNWNPDVWDFKKTDSFKFNHAGAAQFCSPTNIGNKRMWHKVEILHISKENVVKYLVLAQSDLLSNEAALHQSLSQI